MPPERKRSRTPPRRSGFSAANLVELGIETPETHASVQPNAAPMQFGAPQLDPSGLVPEPAPPANPTRVTVSNAPPPGPPAGLAKYFVEV